MLYKYRINKFSMVVLLNGWLKRDMHDWGYTEDGVVLFRVDIIAH